jgi:hypothetical protein
MRLRLKEEVSLTDNISNPDRLPLKDIHQCQ